MIFTREALAEPRHGYVTQEDREKQEIRLLRLALRNGIKKEPVESEK